MDSIRECAVQDCGKTAVGGYREPMCSMHRMRVRRSGSTDDPRQRNNRLLVKGYWLVYQPDHPLLTHKGYVGEHRVVLYDKIGPGSHACVWCGTEISWEGFRWDGIIVDHLDRNSENNSPDNLVPACNLCNFHRHTTHKSHCKHGHEMTAENTRIAKGNHHHCRACGRRNSRESKARKANRKAQVQV